MKDVHLRTLFAQDPARGERLVAEGAGLVLDYSKNRVDRRDAAAAVRSSPRTPAWRRGSTRCSAARRSTSPRSARCCTSRCGRPGASRSWSTARTWCRACTPCSTRWPTSPTACAAGRGRATPGKRIRNVVNIGIGGSDLGPGHGLRGAAPVRRPRASPCASSRTSTPPTSPRPRTTSTRPRRCSSSPPRRSPRSRRSPTPGSRATGRSPRWGTSRPSPSTSWPSRPTPPRWRSSASTPPTCSSSGTGSAGATRTTRPSACR